jgi:D-ribose pyranose/furanose isomerase RbsD
LAILGCGVPTFVLVVAIVEQETIVAAVIMAKEIFLKIFFCGK